MATTATRTTATEADLERIAEGYELRNPEAVVAFVREHPEVVGPLLEAVGVVPRYFGAGTPVVLESERDYDAPDRVQLFALIRTTRDVDAALAALDRFNAGWWLEALRPVATKLTFGLEYA